MQEQKKEITLKQFHKVTDRHVLVLEADMSEQDKHKMLHLSNVIRIAGNSLTAIMKKNYERLIRTKNYRALKAAYAKAKSTEKEDEVKSIASEMKKLQERYNVTWDFCRQSMIEINKTYKINSIFALSKAEDVWSAVEKCLYSDGKSMHFKKYGDYPEIRAKQSNRGIVITADGENLLLKVNGVTFSPVINKPKRTKTRKGNPITVSESHDIFAESEVQAICRYLESPEVIDNRELSLYNKNGTIMDTYRPCFASIVCKRIRGKIRVYVHITVEGLAMPKYRKDGTKRHQTGKGVIGCDIGPQSIAYTSDQEVGLKNLAERGASIKKRERKEALLARKMERSRRIMNFDNYKEDGTIRKGKKTWRKSNRYKKLQEKYRNICRIASENRHFAINEEVNHIRALGNVFVTEPGNAKSMQRRAKKTERQENATVIKKADGTEQAVHKYKRKKRHGKSIKNRCPGYFQAQIRAKFERTGGTYTEVPGGYRASQYDHTCNQYIKKKLSQRMFLLSDGTRVQRDWYASFLLYCIGRDQKNISRRKCKANFARSYEKYMALENHIKANRITVMNSGIKIESM